MTVRLALCRVLVLWITTLVCLSAPSAAAAAAPPPEGLEPRTEIFLMTMGAGDHLYTRGGHAALMVAHMQGDQMLFSTVYNYGDTDWDDPAIALRFATNTLDFRLAQPGDMYDVTEDYGFRQNRDVFLQKLALTDDQAVWVAEHLKATLAPERRNYRYHYVEAICTTKIRDLLDEVLGGVIREHLGSQTDALTTREYQQIAFDGHPLQGLGADLMMGRRNDIPIDHYYSLFHPDPMRERFQEVMVPDPAGGGGLVPLASAPKQLAGRQGPPPGGGRTLGSWWFFGALLVVFSIVAYRLTRAPSDPNTWARALGRRWLLPWSLACGLCSIPIAVVMAVSGVPHFVENELILTFLPLDLWLIWAAVKLARGRTQLLEPVRRYAAVRLGLAILVLLLHVPGWLYQRPLAPPLFVLAGYGILTALLRSRPQPQ